MKKTLIIDIPTPCTKNIETMQQIGNAKFCTQCNKNVIDFRLMSNQQIITYFRQNKKNVCGTFYQEQLNTSITSITKLHNKWHYFFTVFISFFIQSK